MSLINDALKRAKQAQQNTAPVSVPVLQLRPVEPSPALEPPVSSSRASSLLKPGGVALAVLVALLLAWRHAQNGSSPQVKVVQAKTRPDKSAAVPTVPVAAPSHPQANLTTQPMPLATGTTKSSNPPAQPAPVAPLPPKETNQIAAAANVPAAMPSDEETPPLSSLRLQSIIYNPRRPSALINGRIVFIGDRFGELRVVQISRNTVTMVGLGTTNLLDLLQ